MKSGCPIAPVTSSDSKMMDGNQLETDVVLVKVDGKDLYLDPGSPFISFGSPLERDRD